MNDGILTVSIDMSTTKSRQIIFFFGVSGSAYHEANELNPSCHGSPNPYPKILGDRVFLSVTNQLNIDLALCTERTMLKLPIPYHVHFV
jgi:hypothetical protein